MQTRAITTQHSTIQHSTAPYSTAQHSTAPHSTAQHRTLQHHTAQHSTTQHSNDIITKAMQHSATHAYSHWRSLMTSSLQPPALINDIITAAGTAGCLPAAATSSLSPA